MKKILVLFVSMATLLFPVACDNGNENKGKEPVTNPDDGGGTGGNNTGTIDKTIALDILFIGNSLTNGFIEPAVSYNKAAVTDKYGENHGGIPGIFKKMCSDNGFVNIKVAIAAKNGMWLGWHFEDEQKSKYKGKWDHVALQDTYDSFLGANGYDASKVNNYKATLGKFLDFFKADNAGVKLTLHEVAAGPHYLTADRWSYYKTMDQMQKVMKEGHATAASELGLQGWAPVGEAYQESMKNGIGWDHTGSAAPAGKIDLFSSADGYHPSKYGSYLAAAVFYYNFLGDDPRHISTGSSSAAVALGITEVQAKSLHESAFKAVADNK